MISAYGYVSDLWRMCGLRCGKDLGSLTEGCTVFVAYWRLGAVLDLRQVVVRRLCQMNSDQVGDADIEKDVRALGQMAMLKRWEN